MASNGIPTSVKELREHLLEELQKNHSTMVYTDVEQFFLTLPYNVYKLAKQMRLDTDEQVLYAVKSARAKRQAELLSNALNDSRNYRLAYTAISDDDQRSRQSSNWKSEKEREAEKKPAVPEIKVKIVDNSANQTETEQDIL